MKLFGLKSRSSVALPIKAEKPVGQTSAAAPRDFNASNCAIWNDISRALEGSTK